MAKLTTKERNALPDSDFAGPNRSYPVEDEAHARNAKSRAAQFAGPELKKKVDARADKVLGKEDGKMAMHKERSGGKDGYRHGHSESGRPRLDHREGKSPFDGFGKRA